MILNDIQYYLNYALNNELHFFTISFNTLVQSLCILIKFHCNKLLVIFYPNFFKQDREY